MTRTRSNVSATKVMSWLIATTVRPSSDSSPTMRLTRSNAVRVLAGGWLVENDRRRAHGDDGRERQQLAFREAEVVRVCLG